MWGTLETLESVAGGIDLVLHPVGHFFKIMISWNLNNFVEMSVDSVGICFLVDSLFL